jgi:hypothetical protein
MKRPTTTNRRLAAFTFAVLVVLTCGCRKGNARWSAIGISSSRGQFSALSAAAADTVSTQRFVAEHHHLDVVAPESELEKSWEATIAFCGTIHCEIVSSSITARTGEQEPGGMISLRVAPSDLQKLLDHVKTTGQIATHMTERVDDTTQVIDTEAKIKNLTTFRDNLRAMQSKPSVAVKDLVEIQHQLADTQAQLDSQTAQRKVLANETEKIAVEIVFRVARPNEQRGTFSGITAALRESGSVLADSIAALITTIVAAIPWLIVVVPGMWLLIRAFLRLRQKRNRQIPSASSGSSQ